MPIDLHLVEHAIALAQHRRYARAAKALHISQPTLSRSIAALEESLGVRLFDRGRGGVEPTVFGRLLLERGAVLLADAAALSGEFRAVCRRMSSRWIALQAEAQRLCDRGVAPADSRVLQ